MKVGEWGYIRDAVSLQFQQLKIDSVIQTFKIFNLTMRCKPRKALHGVSCDTVWVNAKPFTHGRTQVRVGNMDDLVVHKTVERQRSNRAVVGYEVVLNLQRF